MFGIKIALLSRSKDFLTKGEAYMRCLSSLMLAAFLSAGSGTLTVNPISVVSPNSSEICDQTPKTGKPANSEKTSIPATVSRIDKTQGVLNLEWSRTIFWYAKLHHIVLFIRTL